MDKTSRVAPYTKEQILDAMRKGERLYTEDRQLFLGDPSPSIHAQQVRELIAEGKIVETPINFGKDSEFTLRKETK